MISKIYGSSLYKCRKDFLLSPGTIYRYDMAAFEVEATVFFMQDGMTAHLDVFSEGKNIFISIFHPKPAKCNCKL